MVGTSGKLSPRQWPNSPQIPAQAGIQFQTSGLHIAGHPPARVSTGATAIETELEKNPPLVEANEIVQIRV